MWQKLRSLAAWLADHEVWPLAVGVALATFTSRWAVWGLGLIAMLWLVRWVGRDRLTVCTPLEWPVCLLVLTLPAAFYATTDRQATFLHVSRLLAGLALAYGLANWARHRSHVSLLALGLTGVGLGLSLLALVGVDWFRQGKLPFVPTQVYEMLPTLVGNTIHPNMMAGALVLLLPFPLALLLSPGHLPPVAGTVPGIAARPLDARWFRRLWCGAAVLLMLAVLVLTKSRGGWIAGAVVVFIVLVRRWPYLLGLIPLALLGLGLLAWQGELAGLLDTISTSGAISGWEGRLEVWSRALYMIQDFPFTGVGAGTFQPVANSLYPFFLAGPDAEIPHAHNLLLQVGVDLGYPGLIAFVSILLLSLWCALDSTRSYSHTGEQALAALAWAGLASLSGMLVHGLVDATVWIIGRGAFVPWAVIGTLMALNRRPEPCAGPPVRAGTSARLPAWVAWSVLAALVVLVGIGAYLGYQALQSRGHVPARSSIRLLVYPEAQGVDARTEEAPAEGSWAGPLEIATFTTTHPISDVATFYSDTLAEGGWRADIEAGDATSWGGIYTQDGGHSICMLNAFDIEGVVWTSIVCGDKAQPVDLPSLSPLPTPTMAPGNSRE